MLKDNLKKHGYLFHLMTFSYGHQKQNAHVHAYTHTHKHAQTSYPCRSTDKNIPTNVKFQEAEG